MCIISGKRKLDAEANFGGGNKRAREILGSIENSNFHKLDYASGSRLSDSSSSSSRDDGDDSTDSGSSSSCDDSDDSTDSDSSSSGSRADENDKENAACSGASKSVNADVASKIKLKKMAVSPVKSQFPMEKRLMCYMAEASDIISKKADEFFDQGEDRIREKVCKMNHATRFWLAVKFFRFNKCDFEPNAVMTLKYSQRKMCNILGVGYPSIMKYVYNLREKDTVVDLMKSKKYMSPVEFDPKRHEGFFKNYASNYENLKIGGFFKLRK